MRLIVFDIDGTLVRPTPGEDDVYLAALQTEFGWTGISTNWSAYRNVTDSGILAEIFAARAGRPPTRSEAARFRARYETLLAPILDPQPLPGAPAFLARLVADATWAVAFATGNWRSIARVKLRRAGFGTVDLPLASAEDGVAREGLLRVAMDRALRRFGVAAFAAVVSAGDAPWDARAADALALPFLAVGERWSATPEAPRVRLRDFADAEAAFTTLERLSGA